MMRECPLRNSFRKPLWPQSAWAFCILIHMDGRALARAPWRAANDRPVEANNRTPRLTCALHDLKQREEIFAALQRSGLRVEPGKILQSAFAVSGGSPTRTESFRTGAISIQDEASQTVRCSSTCKQTTAYSICAPRQGKDAASRPRRRPQRHSRRGGPARAPPPRDARAIQRLDLTRVYLVELDAASPLRSAYASIGSSWTPLLRHRHARPPSGNSLALQPPQLAEFHALQLSLLRSALQQLAPGGRLVYSTCSMETEENEQVVAEALRARPD